MGPTKSFLSYDIARIVRVSNITISSSSERTDAGAVSNNCLNVEACIIVIPEEYPIMWSFFAARSDWGYDGV